MEQHPVNHDLTVPRVGPTVPASSDTASRTARRSTSWRRVLQVGAGLGVAAGVAVGATALASAATSTPSSSGSQNPGSSSSGKSTSPSRTGNHVFAGRGFGGAGMGLFGRFGGQFLHGQFTVKGPKGDETLEVQNGTVTSLKDVSGSTWNLVVTSSDKTKVTYVVDSGSSVNGGELGISSVKTGDTVTVVAVVSNGTDTVKDLTDSTQLKDNRGSWMPQGPGGNMPRFSNPPSTSAPSSSSGSQSTTTS